MLWEGRDPGEWCRRLGLPAAEFHPVLESTNARARAWLAAGDAPPLGLVLADAQTAGRGRSGRNWHSPAGAGVWASLLVPGRGLARDALLPLRLGVALAEELERCSGSPVGVKWPNDLFLGDEGRMGKVAGILCERIPHTSDAGDGADGWVVVGVGINVHPVHVPGDFRAAFLGGTAGVGRGPVLEALVAGVRAALERAGDGLEPEELAAWNARDILMGREVEVLGGSVPPARGVARGVDPRGRLRIEGPGGVIPVAAGSVRPMDAVEGRSGAGA